MKALALTTPVVALGLIHLMHLVEVWAVRENTAPRKRSPFHQDKDSTMVDTPGPRPSSSMRKPLPHDPPPPPGWVDPLEGSDVEDLFGAATSPPARATHPSATPHGSG